MSQITFPEVLENAIGWTGLSNAQFSSQAGFAHPDRIYRALKPGGVKLGLDSLEAIIGRFPELNGDRFIRRSGPVLLSELCEEKKLSPTIIQEISSPSSEVGHWELIAQERLKTIERQEKEIDFLRKMLDK